MDGRSGNRGVGGRLSLTLGADGSTFEGPWWSGDHSKKGTLKGKRIR